MLFILYSKPLWNCRHNEEKVHIALVWTEGKNEPDDGEWQDGVESSHFLSCLYSWHPET